MAGILRLVRIIPDSSFAAYQAAPPDFTLLSGETDGLAIDFTDTTYFDLETGSQSWNQVRVSSVDTLSSPYIFYTNNGTSPSIVKNATGVEWSPHNSVLQSEAFGAVAWANTRCSTTANVTTDPLGGLTADRWTEDATASDTHFIRQNTITTVNGFVYTFTVWAKPDTRTWLKIQLTSGSEFRGNYNLSGSGSLGTVGQNGSTYPNPTATITDAGGGWYKCTLTSYAEQTTGSAFLDFRLCTANDTDTYTGDNASGMWIWGAMQNRGFFPTTYMRTTTATVYAPPISYAEGLLCEPAAINLALQSDTFTSASWTKSNMSTAKTATGPDGATNSATTLTASAGNATALQAITSASAARVTHCWLKRRTGSGNIDLTQDNGGTWTTQAVTSSWARFELAAVTSTNPTVGIRIVTSTDAVDVWGFQHEVGSIGTSTISTATATTTRATAGSNVATSGYPHSASAGTFIVWFDKRIADATNADAIINVNDGTVNERMAFVVVTGDTPDSVGLDIVDGGAPQVVSTATKAGSVTTAGNKGAAFYTANDSGVLMDAGSEVTDPSCTIPAVTNLQLGYSQDTGSRELNGFILRLIYVPRRMTQGQMQAKTT